MVNRITELIYLLQLLPQEMMGQRIFCDGRLQLAATAEAPTANYFIKKAFDAKYYVFGTGNRK